MGSNFDRNRVKHHFDRVASLLPKRGEDLSQVSFLHHIRLRKTYELFGALKDVKVLDVGCGTGLAVEYILENGGKYFGVDLSREMLKECRRSLDDDNAAYLTTGIMEHLPFPDTSFDRILCHGALEYVEDVESAVTELSRVMHPGSTVIMTMQNKYSIYRWWDRHVYSGFLINVLRKLWRRTTAGQPLERPISRKNLIDILSRHCFKVENVVYYNFNIWVTPFDRWFPNLSDMTTKILEFLPLQIAGFLLGADFIVQAQLILPEVARVVTPFM